jgi:hypothetical protein
MWTYTAYTLHKYVEEHPERANQLTFQELSDLFFRVIWHRKRVVFHDGEADLYSDFLYLKKLGILSFQEKENFHEVKMKINDKGKLSEMAKIVEESPQRTGVHLLGEYSKRIDSAVKEYSINPLTD